MLTFYNSFPGVRVIATYYKRGWFCSNAVITFEVNNKNYLDLFNHLGVDAQDIPRRYTMDQHIQQGPWIYQNNMEIPWHFGFAVIKNTLRETSDLFRFFNRLGVNHHFIQNNEEYISFNGHQFYYLKLSGMHFLFNEKNIYLKIDGLNSDIGFAPITHTVSGYITFQSVVAENQGDVISLPDFKYEFLIHPGLKNIWVGRSSLKVSQLITSEEDLRVVLSDIFYHSNTDIIAGEFNSGRQLEIGQIQFNDQVMGPFHLQVSVNKVNASALIDMFAAYDAIIKRGELYPMQLEKKMISLLPTLIHSGSSITLERLDINMPHGKLKVNGKLQWNIDNAAIPDELSELLSVADATFHLRVSKSLIDDIIELYVMLPWSNYEVSDDEISNDDVSHVNGEAENILSDNIYYHMQINSLLIELLVNNGQLRDVDAFNLLKLQKEMVPIQDYADQIRRILWSKYLTRQTSYLLYWGYIEVENAILSLENKIQENQERLKLNSHMQLNNLIKKGYLIEDTKDYMIFIRQKHGKIQFN